MLLVTSNFRHLDVVSAKTGQTHVDLILFCTKTMAKRWCPLEQTKCKSNEIYVHLTIFK